MALLHYLLSHGSEYGITVCAVNFDHKMRGEESAADSAFAASYCRERGVPLDFYEWNDDVPKTETSARSWRLECYKKTVVPHILQDGSAWSGADAVATAHHLDDNAETVLFNLARGSGLSGLKGITDGDFIAADGRKCRLIRPLIGCSRAEIDEYVTANKIPFTDDKTNFSDCYTRNKLRLNVLPELERAVSGAAKAIYRFSRIAAEDEEFFRNMLTERDMVIEKSYGYKIPICHEKPLFKRAVLLVLNGLKLKDYTFERLENMYDLQFAAIGKKFEFSGCVALKEEDGISIFRPNFRETAVHESAEADFHDYVGFNRTDFCGVPLAVETDDPTCSNTFSNGEKILRFDLGKIPPTAKIRFMRAGDKFTKFGGGTKNLGSYFSDLKISARVRAGVPVIADGREILIVCGVEISEKVRTDDRTGSVAYIISQDYKNNK